MHVVASTSSPCGLPSMDPPVRAGLTQRRWRGCFTVANFERTSDSMHPRCLAAPDADPPREIHWTSLEEPSPRASSLWHSLSLTRHRHHDFLWLRLSLPRTRRWRARFTWLAETRVARVGLGLVPPLAGTPAVVSHFASPVRFAKPFSSIPRARSLLELAAPSSSGFHHRPHQRDGDPLRD